MTRRIAHLVEEQENQAKLFQTRDLDVKVEITQADSQMSITSTPCREDLLLSGPMK